MMIRARLLAASAVFALGASIAPVCVAQAVDSTFYSGMRWRSIGPFRAGRVSAVAGIPGNAAVYYMASPGGGVWKTIDGGVVWTPIADSIKVASIGAMVVSPSNPDVIYIGTGDVSMVGSAANMGNGVWKSTDAGRTWTHVGLDGTEHIGTMWIDPTNPDVVVVAALGKTFSRNPERGVYKTIDGGRSWRKVLAGPDEETGAIDVVFDGTDKKIGYAALWHHFCKPGDTADLINGSKGGAIFKTTDGGETWLPLKTPGLPDSEMSRIGLSTTMGGKRVYAVIAAARGQGGFYRSDDGGATWAKSTQDTRVTGSGYFSRVFVDPTQPDTVYVAQTSLYRSVDGGKTFISFKGAPGGDDNHALWIDPMNSTRMIMASDQGATISMDNGQSWSSWYNQPTAQIYHMSTDNRWPYWVYGTQQDSGSVGTLSRGDYGAITFMDWDPVAAYEFGYIVPDPKDPNMVYAGGPGRGTVLVNRVNRQVQTISPSVSRDADYRFAQNPPLAFSPIDPKIFYQGTQFLMETRDAGTHWRKISPDLTERAGSDAVNAREKEQLRDTAQPDKKPRTREATETLTPPNRSAINCFSPSPTAGGQIWAGTTNGLIQITRDGGATWQPIAIPGLTEHTLISILESSHFDAATAYAAVDRHQEDDFKPHIYRTRDFGKSWQQVSSGIADGDFVRVVREDPKRKGLLYAGTENGTYVSFDDGDHWSTLQMNLPAASVRDLQINGNDLVAATYGRSFWILDDVSPLREIDAKSMKQAAFLFKPGRAVRVHRDLNGDTPIPPELPAGENPPTGALIDYYLKSAPADDIKLAIYDTKGGLVREFTSRPIAPSKEPPPNVPDYWLGHPMPLTRNAGENRFAWDLRYTAPDAVRHSYPISALYMNTPADPEGPLVVPGIYEARLTVGGKTYKQPLEVGMDPRVNVPADALARQLALDRQAADVVSASYAAYHQAIALRETIAGDGKKLQNQAPDSVKALQAFDAKVVKVQGSEVRSFAPPGAGRPAPTLIGINGQMGSLVSLVEDADSDPTPAMYTAFSDYCRDLNTAVTFWNQLLATDLPAVNEQLAAQRLSPLPARPLAMPASCATTVASAATR